MMDTPMREEASMDQLFLEKVHEAIENNLANENFGVDELAQEIGISRSQLHRRLKILTGQSASQMIREFRLKKAHEMLQKKVATASEISYQVGFSSPSYFNTCFNEYFGYPPGKVKPISSKGVLKKYSIPRKFLFISLAALVVATSVLVIYIETRIPDKSIAVLPFKSLSTDPDKQYLADGVMDAILLHLSKIEDLRVMGRTSVEQYRGTDKTTATICQELDVTYLLEGSFQKYGDQARLIVQLIHPALKDHIWAQEYDRNWTDIFSVQSEVAQLVAKELQVVITPEEKLLIEKAPTTSLTALDFYQRGKEELVKFQFDLDNPNKEAVERAEDLYLKALEHDSTYAQAYTGLAWVYWSKRFWPTYLTENFLDSMLILADKALSFDHQLSEAYTVKGYYYQANNKKEQAHIEYDRAIQYNPNDWMAYYHKGLLNKMEDDFKNSIENYYKAAALYRGTLLPGIYRDIARSFLYSGFGKICEKYAKEALALDDDSAKYYYRLAHNESHNGHLKKGIEFFERSNAIDSTDEDNYFMIGLNYTFLGQFEEALVYYKKSYEIRQAQDRPEHLSATTMLRIGQAYLNIGNEAEATYYFNRARELYNELDELERMPRATEIIEIFERALLYACLGDKEKAFEYLKIYYQTQHIALWLINQLKVDPGFDSIRDEPEYQQILRNVETKYQADHERVRQWLEENDIL